MAVGVPLLPLLDGVHLDLGAGLGVVGFDLGGQKPGVRGQNDLKANQGGSVPSTSKNKIYIVTKTTFAQFKTKIIISISKDFIFYKYRWKMYKL